MSSPHRILVDDTDTDLIQYTGPWFASTTTQFNALDNNGTPFMGTLHGTTSNASFSFTFNGTSVAFDGTFNETQPSPGSSLAPPPSVQCTVLLSNTVSTTAFNPHIGNNLEFCNQLGPLIDGQHTIIVNVAFPQTDDPSLTPQTFWFDNIVYEASPSSSLSNSRVLITSPDPRMHFSDGWTPGFIAGSPQDTVGNKTNIKNSSFTMDFYATTASYTVDSGPPTIFDIPSSHPVESKLNVVEPNVFLFQTPINKNGPHTLTVVYNGNMEFNSTPLSLNYIVVNNRTSTTTIPNTSSVTSPSFSNTRVKTGAIVGGTLGSVLTIALFTTFLFILLQRRRKRSEGNNAIDESLYCYPPPVNPFIVSREDIVATAGKTNTASTPSSSSRNPPQSSKTRTRHALNAPMTSSDRVRAPRSVAPANTQGILPSSIISQGTPQVRTSTIVRREEDSGIRISQGPNGAEITLLPPEYTLS
ncbi:hypothetical protein JR316_0001459 [Psilocybe cubensis]|uniref:Uncharacterized protein n=1 Tax=Psilocybe cubensis TaxID=181762 RepID=A0ACB8HJ49_PSICU|nr:hypothetical protein JR316_0001459 [Psilocybe cubensis]KAH9487384.1 hypothetical protein JR316_0001459 [Psilocybe cubensis]